LLTDVDINGNNVLFYAFSYGRESGDAAMECLKKMFEDHEVNQIYLNTIEKALINHRQTPSKKSHDLLKRLKFHSNLSDVEILFHERKPEKQAIAEACQLNTLRDFELWCFKIEFSSTDNVKEILKSCENQKNFIEKLATTKTKNLQNILMFAASNIETFKYLLSQLIDLDLEI
jgi:hypothetical protein